jgi:hypothetical protein
MVTNVLGIAEGGVIKAQMFNLAQMFIKCTNVGFSTTAPLLAIPMLATVLLFILSKHTS